MMNEQLIGVIDVESDIVKFSILNHSGNILLDSSTSIELIKPNPGWVEVDAEQIWNAVCITIDEVIVKLKLKNLSTFNIKIIGIINERDTVLAWDSESSKPLCNAIHFTDTRTDTIIQDYILNSPKVLDDIEDTTGSKVTSMFSGIKLKWIINKYIIKQPTTMKTIKFGTLDTWIVWKLTKGNLYVTDITNASRTLLLNLKTLEWSPEACQAFDVPISLLPTIKSSSELYGTIEETSLKGISIGSIFADHQAALYGLDFKNTGQIMSNYGDSCYVSCIVGTEFKKSNNGLITTVAYKIDKEPAVYAFEGWTSVGGTAIEWLKNNMKIVDNVNENIESLNIDVSDVYFVPAFNGLAAPHWKPDAKGIICGMTHFTNKKHIIRAALEAFCFHTKDVCVAFEKDTDVAPSQLFVDGLYSIYNNILSYQADICGIDVISSQMTDDMAIYGSAKAAARVINIELESHQWSLKISKPMTTKEEQKYRYSKWLKAIKRSTGISKPRPTQQLNNSNNFSSNFLSTAYLMAMMGIMAISDKN